MVKTASLGVLGLVIGAILLAPPAAAQTGDTAPSIAMPAPTEERAQMVIVGSSTMSNYSEAIAEHVSRNTGLPPATLRSESTVTGIKAFCAGTGPSTPDILASPRRLRLSEFDRCVKNGVTDIVAVPVGYGALVVVAKKGDGIESLTLGQLYHGIAAEWPEGDEFIPNGAKQWADLDPALPKSRIKWVLPAANHGQRGSFDDLFLQRACRAIPAIKGIFQADERVTQCLALSSDGRVIEAGSPFVQSVLATMARAEPGTLAVLPYVVAMDNPSTLSIVAIDGVVPDRDTIESHDYPFVVPLFYYIKVAHMKDFTGKGPVAGLREFITEATRDSAVGSDGYLTRLGMVPMNDAVRTEARASALRLDRFKR